MARIAARRTLLTGAPSPLRGVLIVGCASQGSSSSAPAPSHVRSVRGTGPADIARCRTDHARRLRTGRVWRFIIRACVGHLQLGRVLV